jgi:outer membrane biosynthesis protein TonB
MPKALRSAICLLFVLLLLSGCGSTKKASTTNTASTSAGASASTQTTNQQSTGSTQAQHASKTREPKAAEAKPEKTTPEVTEHKETPKEEEAYRRRLRVRKARERAAHTPALAFAEAQLPRRRRYPKELQGKFMVACKAAKGSTSSCECIVAKQELNRKIEVGQGLAELLAVELAFQQQGASLEDVRRHRVKTPSGVRRVFRECRHT